MIAVCEPCCRKMSHETPNLGFLYGLLLTYPDEEILFFSCTSHWEALQRNAREKNIDMRRIKYKRIFIAPSATAFAAIWNCILLFYVFYAMRSYKARAILFLATMAIHKYIIKFFVSKGIIAQHVCAIVLHGELDSVAIPHFERTQYDYGPCPPSKTLWEKLRSHSSRQILKKLCNKARWALERCKARLLQATTIQVNYKKSLLYKNSSQIKYILLSHHVKHYLANHMDIASLQLYSLTMPAVFSALSQPAVNDFLKIAIFGYGNSAMLYKLNMELASCDIRKNYEIRIIGMDGSWIEAFPHVTQPIKRVLTRAEMENLASDIDIFLILYEKERYILSCSGSIIEAHSYAKPVLYLDNYCINAFNPSFAPVGIACTDISAMAKVIADITNNYEHFLPELECFRKNICAQREKIDIRNNLEIVKTIFG